MKTPIISVNTNVFRTAIVCLTLSAALLFGQAATAQTITVADQPVVSPTATEGFQALIHPVANTLLMKVHFVNPDKKFVTIVIRNSRKDIVYEKKVGRSAIFHGSFNVADMTDGDYIMEVQSAKQKYKSPFTIQTQQARVAQSL